MSRNKKRKNSNLLRYVLIFVLFIASFGLMAYPFISNYIFENRADGIIKTVKESTDKIDKNEYKEELKKAYVYNEKLSTGHIQLKDPFVENLLEEENAEYMSLLNMNDSGVMGVIEIPCIDVSLPIYHGTSEKVLESGAGHLEGTALPVGGAGTHSVITGHTGLSSAKLFTDLTQLVEGDIFFLQIMNEQLAYQVDNISVVKPEDLDKIQMEKGRDLCTLVTCTPYGINSHRLLVRGTRIDYKEAEKKPEAFVKKKTESKWEEEYVKSLIIASSLFFVMMVVLLIWRTVSGKKERKQRRKQRKRRRVRNVALYDDFRIGHADEYDITEPEPKKKKKRRT